MEGDGSGSKHPQQLFFPGVSPATRLLEKRRQMYEVQDALENQKARFDKDEEAFRKREEDLCQQDLQLQYQLFRFNKFLQDNEAKRRRADTRAADETAQIKLRDEEIKELERQLEESNRQCAELDDQVARNMKYEEFLEKVKASCNDYQEINDILSRYETLEVANTDLMKIARESENSIEEITNEFRSYRKQQEMEMLAYTNKIASLSQELDSTQKARQQLERQFDMATQEDSGHSLYFGRILMSVENIFLRCTAKRGTNIRHDGDGGGDKPEEEVDKDSFRWKQQKAIRELKVILNYLTDFKDMCETLRKDRRSGGDKNKQANLLEAVKPSEPKIEIKTVEVRAGDRGSQNSDSQGNTRELSRVRDTAGGSSEGA